MNMKKIVNVLDVNIVGKWRRRLMKHKIDVCECSECIAKRMAAALEDIQIRAEIEGKLPLDKWRRNFETN